MPRIVPGRHSLAGRIGRGSKVFPQLGQNIVQPVLDGSRHGMYTYSSPAPCQARSPGLQAVQARLIGLSRFYVTAGKSLLCRFRCAIRMAGVEWWSGIVLDAELNRLGRRLACEFSSDGQTEVDTRCHPTGRNDVAVFDHACFFMSCADQRAVDRCRPSGSWRDVP